MPKGIFTRTEKHKEISRKMIILKCKKCGKIINSYPSRIGRKKYCSKKCQYAGHSVVKKCLNCGVIFKVWKKTDKIGQGKYCSKKCVRKAKTEKRKCLTCGKIFFVWKTNIKKNKGFFHNRKCYAKYQETITGELSSQCRVS